MSIPLFLAMTSQEIHETPSMPEKIAWMSCHFAVDGAGISHIPSILPPNSMLILDDRIPFHGHDSTMICAHLKEIVARHRCSHVLLDFERPPSPTTLQLVKQICAQLPCPVGAPIDYTKDLDCPVFLPPVPPHLPLDRYLAPWTGREIWLEAALDGTLATVTDTGCEFAYVAHPAPGAPMHHSSELFCHYHTTVSPQHIRFSMFRTPQDLTDLQACTERFGVSLAIGLYQELK